MREWTRAALARTLRMAGVACAALLVLIAVVWRRGDWPAQRFLFVYVAPIVVFAAEWVRERLGRVARTSAGALGVDAAAFVAGALRTTGGFGVLPYSGHMLYLAYAVATPTSLPLRVAALALLATTSVFKLALWNDARSWSLGLIAGLALAAVRILLARRGDAPSGDRLTG